LRGPSTTRCTKSSKSSSGSASPCPGMAGILGYRRHTDPDFFETAGSTGTRRCIAGSSRKWIRSGNSAGSGCRTTTRKGRMTPWLGYRQQSTEAIDWLGSSFVYVRLTGSVQAHSKSEMSGSSV